LIGGIGDTRSEVEAQFQTMMSLIGEGVPAATELEKKVSYVVPDTDVWVIWGQVAAPGTVRVPLVAHQSKEVANKALEQLMHERLGMTGFRVTMTKERVPRSILTGTSFIG
jgi:hypothetical protein